MISRENKAIVREISKQARAVRSSTPEDSILPEFKSLLANILELVSTEQGMTDFDGMKKVLSNAVAGGTYTREESSACRKAATLLSKLTGQDGLSWSIRDSIREAPETKDEHITRVAEKFAEITLEQRVKDKPVEENAGRQPKWSTRHRGMDAGNFASSGDAPKDGLYKSENEDPVEKGSRGR